MHQPTELVILGAGFFALEVTDLIEDIGGLRIVGYFINDPDGRRLCEPVLSRIPDNVLFVGAMVAQRRMEFIKQIESQGYKFARVIHPSSSISRTVSGYTGVIINRLVAIGSYASIGKHTVINRSASIGHHVEIGDFCTIGPGANIAGNVVIGENALIGMGANILEGRKVGRAAVIGAGAVVTRDVPDYTKAIGIPARWEED